MLFITNIMMKLPESFNTLSQKNKKVVLYKIAEIYWWDDDLLEFIDSLEWDNIDTICNIVFAKNHEEREKLRNDEFNSLWKTIEEIDLLRNSIDRLIIEITEFSQKIEDEKNVEDIEDILANIN
jgi:hypothetical protein